MRLLIVFMAVTFCIEMEYRNMKKYLRLQGSLKEVVIKINLWYSTRNS
jgi:hypothetical protein